MDICGVRRFSDGIHQEVSALMIFMLLTAELEHQARVHHAVALKETPAGGTEEPEIRFNRRQIAECVGHLLIAAANGTAAIDKEYTDCLADSLAIPSKTTTGKILRTNRQITKLKMEANYLYYLGKTKEVSRIALALTAFRNLGLRAIVQIECMMFDSVPCLPFSSVIGRPGFL